MPDAIDRRLQTTLDSIGEAVISTDREGRIEHINPVAAELTGWALDACAGKLLGEVYRIAGDATPTEAFARVVAGPPPRDLVNYVTLLRRDGAALPIAETASPIRQASGDVEGVVVVFRDMTAEWAAERERFRMQAGRAHAEAALRHSQQTLASALGNVHEGVVLVDRGGKIIYRNPAATRISGPDDDLIDMVVRAIDGAEVRDLEISRGGTWLSISSSGIVGDDGTPIGTVASFRDITHRKRLDDERVELRRIEAASRLKSEFLANMSHELRTPLNAIVGFAELLYDGLVGPTSPQQHEFLGDILTSGQHLLRLINDILDLSKIEAGRLELHPEAIDAGALVREVAGLLRATAAAKQLRIEVAIAPDLGELRLDPSRLKQVLFNYLSNAIKFTPPGGRVSVRALAEDAARVRFVVEDTGIGIAAAELDKLFAEFHQIQSGATKGYAGTGLGLALTKRLVAAQGGEVGVTSEPGVGSRFHAILPRRT